MFFQKNISEDLELDRRFRVSKATCLILFNLQHFHFIFYFLSFYYNFHRSCALTICSSCHWIYLIIVFSFLEKSYTRWLIWKWQRRRSRRSERSEDQHIATFFRFVIEHSICWLHHRVTSIDVVNSEDRDEANEVKINSTLCSSNLSLSIRFADYIIELFR